MSAASPAASLVRLPVAQWPAADAAAWQRACHPQPGPFSAAPPRSPQTYRAYAQGYGAYLGYLQSQDLLSLAETPAERVTRARLGGYYDHLMRAGKADYTVANCFDALRGALRLMHPDRAFGFITKPGAVSIRQLLPMNRRSRFVPDSRHAALWADSLFTTALTLTDPVQRRLQVRDAALLGIMAARAPRLRAIAGMRLGRHLRRVGDIWHLFFDESLMKGGRTALDLPLGARVSAIVERYLTVERLELLRGQDHDAVWVTKHGRPLAYKGIDFMVRARTQAQFGVAFGSHRFRTSLTTTQALIDGKTLLGTAQLLSHTPAVALKHYNRASALAASRRHSAHIDAAEAAAARLFRQR